MKVPFNFRYAGFRSVYEARATDQTISIYCGDEFVTFFEPSEIAAMVAQGNIQMIFEENK